MVEQTLAAIALLATGLATGEKPPVETALQHSVELCARSVVGGDQSFGFPIDVYPNFPVPPNRRGDFQTAADVPELIHRFAATTQSGRIGWGGDFLKVPSAEGAIWVVVSGSMPFCDVGVTGLAQIPRLPRALVDQLQSDGWSLLAEQGTDESAPIWRLVLQKPAPEAEQANRVVRLTIQGIRVGSGPDGIQMELNVVAGQLRAN